MDNWFEIGVITKPQGIRGEVRVHPTTDDPARFALLDEVYIRHGKAPDVRPYKLKSVRHHKGMALITLEGVDDRNTAEKLTGGMLLIPPEKALPLESNEYFIRDLVGLSVKTEDGTVLGEITDVFPTGANDVYIVRDADGESFMIPAIKDVVLGVSLGKGEMTVRMIDGLRELKV